ncbi:MAG TPA: helix-turn-helix domain-containing protein [Cyclobacteriaceae bacterium]|nr:helix-turn-helix domain-containing protein [Cyclobacteriaceae bacterium]
MNVLIKEFKPAGELSPYVVSFWEGNFNINNSPLLTQRVVPNGFVEIIFHISSLRCNLFKDCEWSESPPYTIIGLHTQPYIVRFSGCVQVFGIRLKPEGIYNLFKIPSTVFNASHENLQDVLGSEFNTFCRQLCEADETATRIALTERYLLKSVRKNAIDLNYVHRAAEIIRSRKGLIVMDELSDEVCISRRQLERGFSANLGISPKHYMRLSRVNEVHKKLLREHDVNLMDMSYYCGYSDQAHFIREFKNFTGLAPRIFMRNRQEFIVNAA